MKISFSDDDEMTVEKSRLLRDVLTSMGLKFEVLVDGFAQSHVRKIDLSTGTCVVFATDGEGKKYLNERGDDAQIITYTKCNVEVRIVPR